MTFQEQESWMQATRIALSHKGCIVFSTKLGPFIMTHYVD